MPKDKDYYKILGVSKNATKEEVKKSYKDLAKKYHPDINKDPDAAEKFKEVSEAASVLGDDENASVYFKIASESAKLDRQYRAQCYASLALIAHKNFKAPDAEKYIAYSLKVDDKQPFSFLLASKIFS